MSTGSTSETPRPFKWGFASSAGVILVLVVAGQVVGNVVGSSGAWRGEPSWRDAIFAAFLVCALAFLWLQRGPVLRFFRAMHTGVMLVAFTTLAVATGVLVPQIEGFEDPDERVADVSDVPSAVLLEYLRSPKMQADDFRVRRPDDNPVLANLSNDQVERVKGYRAQFDMFKFAESYFLYHLLHPYGIGMPSSELPAPVVQKLESFGQRYGKEERDNREKQMMQAFGGQPKSLAIAQFTADHFAGLKRAFDVCTTLQLNRTYKSNWFAALLWLLATGVALNSFRGQPTSWLTLRKAGWIVVHCGVLLLLAGGMISKFNTSRGILQLDLRSGPRDTYWGFNDPQKPMRMPFHVKLDRFARKDWPTLEIGFQQDQFTSRLPEYTLWPGREIGIDWVKDEESGKLRPNLRLRVKELAERALVKPPRFWEADTRDDPKGIGSLVELSVAGDDSGARPLLLKPDSPSDLYADPSWSFRLRAAYTDHDADVDRMLHAEAPGHLGWLDVGILTQGHVEPRREPIALGQTLAIGEYRITVSEATANFQLDERNRAEVRDSRPLAEQPPRNPAVWVTIAKEGDDRSERRPILQSIDAEQNKQLQAGYAFKEVALKLVWDVWGGAGPPRYVLQWGANTPARLVSSDGKRVELAAGAALPIASPLASSANANGAPKPARTTVTLGKLYHNARFEKTIEFLAPHVEGPHFDADFYSPDPVGLELEITRSPGTPKETTEVVRMASTESGLADLWQASDESFYVRFYENQAGFPFEWRSVLSIWQDDGSGSLKPVDVGPEFEREIRVNDYFHYRGYRFFQSNAEAERPTYSGIGVVYDPGIPIVLYGMYTIIVGTILAFLLRPIAQAYGKQRTEASS